MELIAKLANELDMFVHENKDLMDEPSGSSFNPKVIESRQRLIDQLDNILNCLPTIAAKVESVLAKVTDVQVKELNAMDCFLSKLKKKEAEDWVTIVRKKPVQKLQSRVALAMPVTYVACTPVTSALASNTHVQPAEYSKIKFTEALSLQAIRVPTFDYVKQNGELYYVESSNHFAIKIGGKLLHGNIGAVYTDEKNPGKIKDCKFADLCMKRDKCDYYHDPVKFPGSHDCRNFIASSFLYSPPHAEHKNRSRSRRFGSREHLDKDIVGLGDEEINRFYDQTMHDILCSLLINTSYSAS